jgi:hypothetical protein
MGLFSSSRYEASGFLLWVLSGATDAPFACCPDHLPEGTVLLTDFIGGCGKVFTISTLEAPSYWKYGIGIALRIAFPNSR